MYTLTRDIRIISKRGILTCKIDDLYEKISDFLHATNKYFSLIPTFIYVFFKWGQKKFAYIRTEFM